MPMPIPPFLQLFYIYSLHYIYSVVTYKVFISISGKFLAFAGPHEKKKIENGNGVCFINCIIVLILHHKEL